jgi:hypothetical protein
MKPAAVVSMMRFSYDSLHHSTQPQYREATQESENLGWQWQFGWSIGNAST